jgi:hypothetical protein
MVKVQHQLNKIRTTKFAQTQTRQENNYGLHANTEEVS